MSRLIDEPVASAMARGASIPAASARTSCSTTPRGSRERYPDAVRKGAAPEGAAALVIGTTDLAAADQGARSAGVAHHGMVSVPASAANGVDRQLRGAIVASLRSRIPVKETDMNLTRRAVLMTSAAIAANVLRPELSFAQATPRKGGVFTVHFGAEQRQLNPSLQASTGVYIIGGKIQEQLVDLDADGQAGRRARRELGGVARRQDHHVQAAPGRDLARRQAVHLRRRRLHGDEHVEEDPELRHRRCSSSSPRSIRRTPNTAVFRYERPMPLNLLLRALPDLGYISPKHLYEDKGDIRQNPLNLAPVGTGPFKFVQYERGQYIIADRNPNYWRPNAPYLDRIVWRVVTDRAAAAAQMEAGQIHYSPFSGLTISDMARLGKDPRFIVSTKGNEGNARTNTIEFNFRRKELADIRVRRAIAHAINIPFFIENFLGAFAKRGTGPIPSVSTDFYPADNGPQYPYDKALAAKLLDEAGFKATRRHALLAAAAAGAMGRGHLAVRDLHPAIAVRGRHQGRHRAQRRRRLPQAGL